MTEDEKHLQILSTCHYVYGGFSLLMAVVVVVFFGFIAWAPWASDKQPPKPEIDAKVMFAVIAILFFFTIPWMVAHVVCTFLAGKFLTARRL